MEVIEDRISKQIRNEINEEVVNIVKLPSSGSYRQYYRVTLQSKKVLGVYNEDVEENEAYFSYTQSFKEAGLKVPEIFHIADDRKSYLIEDLGELTLFGYVSQEKDESKVINVYKKVLDALLELQTKLLDKIDLTKAFPRAEFDDQSIQWDLNYFKYNFLKPLKISFHEGRLEKDFQTFKDYLLEDYKPVFLYRDFQSANILIKDNEVNFIDFQGGRKGAAFYDVASLLYDAKAKLNDRQRNVLLDYYYGISTTLLGLDKDTFESKFAGYLLVRMMQAMGAYGFRGLMEKKTLFVKSIYLALSNLDRVNKKYTLNLELPELQHCFKQLIAQKEKWKLALSDNLTVFISSFSYRGGLPLDVSDHGGGFVFDCRGLPNPGRLEAYKKLTGADKPVADYLDERSEADVFYNSIYETLKIPIQNYTQRGHNYLSVNFGCTGGQHRSVFMALKLYKQLKREGVNCIIYHREQPQLNDSE